MFCQGDQFLLNFNLLRGLAAMGNTASEVKQMTKYQIAKVLLADLVDPRNTLLDHNTKVRYIAEIRMYCPDLF